MSGNRRTGAIPWPSQECGGLRCILEKRGVPAGAVRPASALVLRDGPVRTTVLLGLMKTCACRRSVIWSCKTICRNGFEN